MRTGERRPARVATYALLVALVVGAGLLVRPWLTGVGAGEVLPSGQTRFAEQRVTWAQGTTIHYGADAYDVGPSVVEAMLRTPYGFFLTLVDREGRLSAQRETVFFDGERTTPVPGEVSGGASGVRVSPDGRFVGWIDRAGPLRPAGRVAEVVVVDLDTGETVFRTSEGMGGGLGDDLGDLYEELSPVFVGFDDAWAYWHNAEGSGERWRWNLTTGEVEQVRQSAPGEDPTGRTGDSLRGYPSGIADGRPAPLDGSMESGFLSPDERHSFVTNNTGKLPVFDTSDGRRVTPRYGHRWVFFGGWQDGDTFYVLARERFEFSYDPEAPDRTEGTLLSCALPSGACSPVSPVTGTRSIVFGYGATSTFEAS